MDFSQLYFFTRDGESNARKWSVTRIEGGFKEMFADEAATELDTSPAAFSIASETANFLSSLVVTSIDVWMNNAKQSVYNFLPINII